MYIKLLTALAAGIVLAPGAAIAQGAGSCPSASSPKASAKATAPPAKKVRSSDERQRTHAVEVYARESELLARQLREAIAKLKPEEIKALLVILSDAKLLETITQRISEAMRPASRGQIVITPSAPANREGTIYYYYPLEKGPAKPPAEEKSVNQLQETIRQFITP